MANTKSAKKMVRKIERRTAINKMRRSRVRTYLRKVEEAIAASDQPAAIDAFRTVQPQLQRAGQKGIFHKNTVARKLSRLSSRIKAISA
ncbi:MAG: 30S ribosomal protein S20 [Pseudomonadota bacterium]